MGESARGRHLHNTSRAKKKSIVMICLGRPLLLLVCVATCLAEEQPIQMSNQAGTEAPEEAAVPTPEDKPKTQTVLSNSEEKPEVKEEVLGLPVADNAGQDSEALVVLDGSSWATVLKNPGFTFVKFYAPWCGHCREMQHDWEDVAEHFKENPVPGVSLTVAEVDCTAGMDGSMSICMQESIHGYPTVRLYKDGDLVEEYHFARTFDRMKAFVVEKLFDLSAVEPNSIGVYNLDDLSFQKFIDSQGSSATLVFFGVPWCGHCKELRPVWDDLAIDFLMEESEDIKFAEVNCMEALDVCTEEGVEGFPQIYMYKDGVMEDIFQGDRTTEELTNFIWETVDPSRVKDDELDTLLMMQNLMGGDGDDAGEEDLDYEDEEADDEEFSEDYDFEEGEEELGDDEEEEEEEDVEGEDEEEEEEEDEEEGREVTEEEMEHIKKMIIDEAEKAGEKINPDEKIDAGEDYNFDADEDAMLFAEGDTEEKMSDEWLAKMMEMDEKKEEKKKKKIQGTNAKELKDRKHMESAEEEKTEKDKEKRPTLKEEL